VFIPQKEWQKKQKEKVDEERLVRSLLPLSLSRRKKTATVKVEEETALRRF
jgi:hypothetical protein